jgi:glutamine amidotransferase
MCRHIAWLGVERTLADLMLDQPHGLSVQSYAPRRQKHGLLNGDGWGVGYFPAHHRAPARWRSSRPLWNDANFASVAPTIASTCVIGAVRSASVGMPIEDSAVAPFSNGEWLVSHNGQVDRAVLPQDAAAESVCDSAILAALVFSTGPSALADVVMTVAAKDPAARLNLLAVSASRILATTWGDTLSCLETEAGVVVASEPYDDDPDWVDVPDRHLVDVTAAGLSITPLEITA